MSHFHEMPFAQWPERDRLLWDNAMSRSLLLDPGAIAASWRPRTRATVRESYGIALDWLARSNRLDLSVGPTERWHETVAIAYAEDLLAHVSPVTAKQRILNLERALAAMEPNGDRAHLRRLIRRLKPTVSHAQKRERLQEPAVLEKLGRDLMEAARQNRAQSDRKNAALFRDGLQIALLASRPLRKGNFASMEIPLHLYRDRQTSRWRLRFEEGETKNYDVIDESFPSALVDELEEYLAVYRPLLAGLRYAGTRLWVSYRFGPQAPHSIQLAIVGHTARAFGLPVNPHLFRDCVATAIAIDDPEHVRVSAAVLGHRSFGTTERHYNLSRTLDAARTVSTVIDRKRDEARRRRG
jgi:integrase